MQLNELKPSVPRKDRKRIGRGESSGQGKTKRFSFFYKIFKIKSMLL